MFISKVVSVLSIHRLFIRSRTLVRNCILLLMLLPATIPQGYMVSAPDADGLISITICSGVNPRQVWMNPETGAFSEVFPNTPTLSTDSLKSTETAKTTNNHSPGEQGSLCPFFLVASAVEIASASFSPLLPVDQEHFRLYRLILRTDQAKLLHLPPRGPPVLS